MAHKYAGEDRRVAGTSFIGSFLDEPDQAEIVLRGDIDAAVVERLGSHLDDVLARTTRFITIDAAAVDSYDDGLLDLLGRTQHRLGGRRGLLRVRGLRPCLLASAVPVSEPVS